MTERSRNWNSHSEWNGKATAQKYESLIDVNFREQKKKLWNNYQSRKSNIRGFVSLTWKKSRLTHAHAAHTLKTKTIKNVIFWHCTRNICWQQQQRLNFRCCSWFAYFSFSSASLSSVLSRCVPTIRVTIFFLSSVLSIQVKQNTLYPFCAHSTAQAHINHRNGRSEKERGRGKTSTRKKLLDQDQGYTKHQAFAGTPPLARLYDCKRNKSFVPRQRSSNFQQPLNDNDVCWMVRARGWEAHEHLHYKVQMWENKQTKNIAGANAIWTKNLCARRAVNTRQTRNDSTVDRLV